MKEWGDSPGGENCGGERKKDRERKLRGKRGGGEGGEKRSLRSSNSVSKGGGWAVNSRKKLA